MRITVGMIVFNAESVTPPGMLKACVEAAMKFADEVIIVEGATNKLHGRRDGEARRFTLDGRSTDMTLPVLYGIPDPNRKLKIIPARGWWGGKTAMCNEYAKHATGDYLWHVDSDEFYHERELPIILKALDEDRPDAVHFFAHHFWGGFTHCLDESQNMWGNDLPWKRIFRHTPGSQWLTHEPPDYILADGRACNNGKVLVRDEMMQRGVRLYHYGYAWRRQAEFKGVFFSNPEYMKLWDAWQLNKALPLIRGTVATPFRGEHPQPIRKLLGTEP